MEMYKDINLHEYLYNDVMTELNKKFWNDFDFHRDKMSSVFSKIKNIKWLEVNSDVYDKLINTIKKTHKHPLLECSRYSHRTYTKCYPNHDECYECFKYWCTDCNKGSNSMYSSCNGKRCIRFFEGIPIFSPMLFEIKDKDTPKRIYIFKNDTDFFLDNYKKVTLKNREMYGF